MIRTLYITYMGLTEHLLHSQVLNYLKILNQKNISVYILSFEKRQFLTEDKINRLKEELDRSGINWWFLTYHKSFKFLSKPYDIIKGMFFVFYLSFKERIDVIHARGTLCVLIGIMPWLFLRKKMIFDIRGFMAEEYVDAGLWKRRSFVYNVVDKLERHFIKKADEIVLLAKKAKDLLSVDFALKNVTVIPTCVDLERFDIKKEAGIDLRIRYSLDKEFVISYVGSLGSWYMLGEMVQFYQELNQLEQNAKFFILSQTKKAYIQERIPIKLRKDVIIESVSPEEVADFLNLADIGIFFIKPCFSKTASCPTKFGEYLACGLPVVINSGIGDTDDIVRDNRVGIVVENFNKEEYRKGIAQLKELLKEGDALRNRCRKVAQNYFSLKQGTERYFKIYQRLK